MPDYAVRVKFQNKKKFLSLSEKDLNWKTFVDKGKWNIINEPVEIHCDEINFLSGLSLFDVRINENSTVYLTDNMGTEIPTKLFDFVIKSFWNGSNFYVEIKYTRDENKADLVTPEVNLDRSFYIVQFRTIIC